MKPTDHINRPSRVTHPGHEGLGSEATMRAAIDLAVHDVAGADAAALTIVQRRRATTPVATDECARHATELQHVACEGPTLSAIWERPRVLVPDVSAENRWPMWAEAMTQQSAFRSVLVLRLDAPKQRLGALNLYSTEQNGFNEDDELTAAALVAHIAMGVGTALEVETLREALETRTLIAQAQGIAMERYGLDAAEAFALLKRFSSHSNRKVRDVASELVGTRRLPHA